VPALRGHSFTSPKQPNADDHHPGRPTAVPHPTHTPRAPFVCAGRPQRPTTATTPAHAGNTHPPTHLTLPLSPASRPPLHHLVACGRTQRSRQTRKPSTSPSVGRRTAAHHPVTECAGRWAVTANSDCAHHRGECGTASRCRVHFPTFPTPSTSTRHPHTHLPPPQPTAHAKRGRPPPWSPHSGASPDPHTACAICLCWLPQRPTTTTTSASFHCTALRR